ncbi:MAG: response regulator [Planctomycetes bacterium]|nr:response regulator [Planctomycetota bacterium]MBI3847065.1 response regulator [Planctomycetota bacterium]
MVVEDDLICRKLLVRFLEKAGYTVVEFESATSALQAIGEATFDLIMTDVSMPEMSGIEFIRRLRADARTALTPIIVCTANAEKDIVVEAVQMGIRDYVLKPIDRATLLPKIEEVKGRIRPPLADPTKVASTLGMDGAEYKELLTLLVKNVSERLAEARAKIESGDVQALIQFARDVSCSASNLGADALQNTATQAATMPTGDSKPQIQSRLASIEGELNRLQQAITELS